MEGVYPPPINHHSFFIHLHPMMQLSSEDVVPPSDSAESQMQSWPKAGHAPLTLLDIHGVLMIIAWLGLIPSAVFSARYLRSAWPEKSWFGLKIWFHIHRTLNVVAVLLIVMSTGMAFYARGKWTGPWFGRSARENTSYGAWHSFFGILAVSLAVRQPFNALLRCRPDHPRRPLFNWMHRITGLVAYAFAMVPLFIGVFIRRILHRKLSEWLLIAYHLALLLLVVAAELVNLFERKENRQRLIGHNDEDSECEGCGPEENAAAQTRHFVRKTLFFLLILTSMTCSGMLALFILRHG